MINFLLVFHQGFSNDVDCTLQQDVVQETSNFCVNPQEIQHKLIKIVDGTPKANVRQLDNLQDDIKIIREGINGKGFIGCSGQAYTLKQLVIAEREKALSQKDTPECLNNALTKFEEKSEGYLKQARGFKALMLDIINQWASQRNRQDSILKEWGKQPAGSEHAEMRKIITSFIMLDHFLNDLSCFLKDFRFTCKKSSKIYEDWKAKHGK